MSQSKSGQSKAEQSRKQAGPGASLLRHRPPFLAISFALSFGLLLLFFLTYRQLRNASSDRLRLLAAVSQQVESTVADLADRFVKPIQVEPHQAEPDQVDLDRQQDLKISELLRPVQRFKLLPEPVPRPPPAPRKSSEGNAEHDEPEYPVTLVARSAKLFLSYHGGDEDGLRDYSVEVDLADLFEPTFQFSAFDALLLANADGEILVQYGEPEVRMVSMEPLLNSLGVSGSFLVGESDLAGSPADSVSDSATKASRAGVARLAGRDYYVFFQPITVDLPRLDGRPLPAATKWVACGLAARNDLLAASFTNSPVLLSLLIAVFPLAMLAYPFVKLVLIAKRQRFTGLDVAALAFCTLLGVSLLVFLVFGMEFLFFTQDIADEQLAKLSSAVESNLMLEIDHIRSQLGDYDDRRYKHEGGRASDEEKLEFNNGFHEGPFESTMAYPLFHTVFWAGGKGDGARYGRQIRKVRMPSQPELKVSVAERSYFKCADPSNHDLGPGSISTPSQGDDCLESIRSKVSGEDELVIARASKISGQVVAISARLNALAAPVLAPGFGFAIVDSSGKVHFHSDRNRNLIENYLKATNENQTLAAMLEKRRRGYLSITYWGEPHRVYLRPLNTLPWSLVTFRSTRDTQLRVFPLAHEFLNPLLIYLTLAILMAIVCSAFLPEKAVRLLWPYGKLGSLYRRVVLAVPVIGSFFALLIAWRDPVLLFVASIGLPLLILTYCVYCVRKEAKGAQEKLPGRSGGGGACVESDESEIESAEGSPLNGWRQKFFVVWKRELAWYVATVTFAVSAFFVSSADGVPLPLAARFLLILSAALILWFVNHQARFRDLQRRLAFRVALGGLILVAGVLPAVGFVTVACWRQSQFAVMDAQLGLARATEIREEELSVRQHNMRHVFSDIPQGSKTMIYGKPLQRMRIAYRSCFFPPPGIYGRRQLVPLGAPESRSGANGLVGLVNRVLSVRFLTVNDLTAKTSTIDLSRFESHTARWDMGPNFLSAAIPLDWGQGKEFSIVSETAAPTFSQEAPSGLKWAGLLFALAVLAMMPLSLAKFIAEKVLLISLVKSGAVNQSSVWTLAGILDEARKAPRRRIWLVTAIPELATESAETDCCEFVESLSAPVGRQLTGKVTSARPERSRNGLVIFQHFHPELSDPAAGEEELETFKEFLKATDKAVVLVSQHGPREIFLHWGADAETAEHRQLRQRWEGLLTRFEVRYGRDAGLPLYDDPDPDKEQFSYARRVKNRISKLELEKPAEAETSLRQLIGKAWTSFPGKGAARKGGTEEANRELKRLRKNLRTLIIDECGQTRRLQEIGLQVVDELHLGSFTPEEVVSRIAVLARPYYQNIWDGCSIDEKLVLVRLAEDRLVNPKNFDHALELLQRGLIRRDPALRLMSRSFGSFVLRSVNRADIQEWEDAGGVSAWSVFKWLLPLPLLLFGGFLFITQRESLSNVVAVVVGLGSVAPILVNLYNYFITSTTRTQIGEAGK